MADKISCMAGSSATANVSGWSGSCYCCCETAACVAGGNLYCDLLGDTGHPTGLDCPAGVVGCGCGGDAVTACRNGSNETVYTNPPSNGVTVSSVVRACRSYGPASGGECVWQRVDRDTTECSIHSFLLFIVRIQVYQCSSLVLDLV